MTEKNNSLAIVATHPTQYHCPMYRALKSKFGISVTAIYGSDFSVSGYLDSGFGKRIAWDTDLMSGYDSIFLSRVLQKKPGHYNQVRCRGLKEALAQSAPKAVLISGYGHRLYRYSFLESCRTGYPIMFRGETTDRDKERNFMHVWARDVFLKLFYGRCAKLLYIGRNSYKHYKRLGIPDEKLIFSPYCVDSSAIDQCSAAHEKIRRETRKVLNIAEDRIVLAFSGKLIHRKGPDLITAAVEKLPPDIVRRIVLMFIGDGRLKTRLEKTALHGGRVDAVFTGFKNQTEIGACYHASDILVLPSRHSETWGLVVNEALHHGLPCVVSEAVGCAPDLITPGVTGEVFITGSSSSLGAAIRRAVRLAADPKTAKACRDKVNNYTVDKAAAGIAEAYKSIVDTRR